MTLINRKLIEDYYENEWKEFVSPQVIKILSELTCQAYKLNQPHIPSFIKEQEPPKPQNLGHI